MKFVLSFCLSLFLSRTGFALPAEIHGTDLVQNQQVALPTKNLVVVFMSAKCPCSDSHLAVLKKLSENYKDYKFVAVHANSDEGADLTKTYFAAAKLPFPVVQDVKGALANDFKALKTPHAFVFNARGEIAYQGGVTNSAKAESADKNFLAAALEDLHQGHEVKVKNGRTLGCIILRDGEQNTW
jgi:thioredoxin-related protein